LPGAASGSAAGFAPAGPVPAPYRYPTLGFLSENPDAHKNLSKLKAQTQETAVRLEETLLSFKVRAKVVNVMRGPSVTQYEVEPDVGVKVSTIVNLAEDISLKLGVSGIRIAPVADRSAIGIEVPNREVSTVVLRDIIESEAFTRHPSPLAFAVGVDISGSAVMADIAKMPHLLVAGATGSGKSVCINGMIISLLYKSSPDDVKLIMIDPKVVELGMYNGIPHLLIPVVTDPRKAAGALAWAVQEMLTRYNLFAEKKVKDLTGYNNYVRRTREGEKLPRIVIIIDELADLMMAAPKEVQDSICRLAQMARAAGMHLVIATQRPTVDVITGLIKSNVPSRIAFRVSSQTDSRVILDIGGAEKLLGRGDMLFYPVGEKKPIRLQGAFISEEEVERVVEHVKVTQDAEYDEEMIERITSAGPSEDDPGDNDELLPLVIEHVVEAGQASTSMIQRKFKVGYSRAARMVDQMEARGVVSGFDGSKPRQILISKQQLYEMKL
jgi:S-DNA-T family DNA segregation ATPase FtsK/SpoIIIE